MGRSVLAVEAVNRQPGGRIPAGGDFLVEIAVQAVLRAENGPHLDAGGVKQQIEGRAAGGVDAGLIGDHPDPFALQGGEPGAPGPRSPAEPGQAVSLAPNPVITGSRPASDQVASGRRPHGHGRGHGRRSLGPQGLDLPWPLGWRRVVRMIMKVLERGSIQMEVPV